MDLISIKPQTSMITLRNKGATDIGVSIIESVNAQVGQVIILSKENTFIPPDDGTGDIYLVSRVDPQPDPDSMSGNISLPADRAEFTLGDTSTNGYNQMKITNDLDDSGSVHVITKTFVQLMFDGETWKPISVNDTVTYKTPPPPQP